MRVFSHVLILLGVLLQAPLCFSTLKEKHWDPFVERATDAKSQQLFMAFIPANFLTQTLDNSARDQWKDHQVMKGTESKYGDQFDQYAIAPLFALSQLYFDPKEGEALTRALIYNGIATQFLKVSVQRRRPGSDNLRSFPSGHSSTAFATATALTYSYGIKAAIWAYPLATFVGLSRMADDKHWFSDVVSGAFLGIWIGRAASFPNQEKIGGRKNRNNFSAFVTPRIGDSGADFQLLFNF